MTTVCVYLGANSGNNDQFSEATILLAKELADMGFNLVYGGSSLGMMGLLATTVKEHGGKIIGIITKQLIEREKPLGILDKLHIVDTMQERKRMMQPTFRSINLKKKNKKGGYGQTGKNAKKI